MVIHMTDLLLVETKRIVRKCILALLICIIFSISIFLIQYEKDVSQYKETRVQEINNAISSYKRELQTITSDNQDIKIFLDQQISDLSLLKIYYDTNQDDIKIMELENRIDETLYQNTDNGIFFDKYILRNHMQDLTKRIMLAEAYKEKGIIQRSNEKLPTLAYTLYTALDGFTPFMIGVILMIIIWTTGMWIEDYEYRFHYILYSSPFKKKSIFWARNIVYGCFAILIASTSLITLGLCAYIKYGSGFQTLLQQNIGIYKLTLTVKDTIQIVNITEPLFAEICIFMFFMLCYFLFLEFCSLIIKSKFDGVIYMVTILFLNVYFFQYVIKDNIPLTQIGISTLHTTLMIKYLYLLICCIILYYINIYIFHKKEG